MNLPHNRIERQGGENTFFEPYERSARVTYNPNDLSLPTLCRFNTALPALRFSPQSRTTYRSPPIFCFPKKSITHSKMSNFKSFVERTIHVQLQVGTWIPTLSIHVFKLLSTLQQFTRFQTTVPLFAALVVFSSFPFVGRTSPTSVSALAAPLRKALTKRSAPEGVPFLTSLFNIFARALNTACLRARVHVKIPLEWRHMFARARPRRDDTYATPRAEAQYWRIADRYRRRLYSGSGTAFMPSTPSSASRDDMVVPLVTYYTPRLLPLYRDHTGGKRTSREANVDAYDARISPRTFCKWHRMVFQDSVSPLRSPFAL